MDRTHRNLVVFTGAGISADSGIQTFRDKDGLWENHSVDAVANLLTWKQNRELVHRFYNERRTQLANVEPNKAHFVVADWQKRYDAKVITQNIDDLFERAGCANVIHAHGDLKKMQCTAMGCPTWDIGYAEWSAKEGRCPACNSLKGVKPNVVFFNEIAPEYPKLWKIIESLTKEDVLVVIGTSGQVIDIGDIAESSYATTVLSNLESAESIRDESFDHVLHGRASERAADLDALVTKLMT
jgi:NAD-dependent deacetylase